MTLYIQYRTNSEFGNSVRSTGKHVMLVLSRYSRLDVVTRVSSEDMRKCTYSMQLLRI